MQATADQKSDKASGGPPRPLASTPSSPANTQAATPVPEATAAPSVSSTTAEHRVQVAQQPSPHDPRGTGPGSEQEGEDTEPEDEDEDDDEATLINVASQVDANMLQGLLQRLGLGPSSQPEGKPEPLLQSFDLAGIAQLIQGGKARKIVCMCGAGISVSAGIPDFRTPGTGLYSQLAKYKLPRPEAVFTLDYFRHNPEPFHKLAQELYPGNHKPTLTHYFLALLEEKGLLLRCFTQNIDSLETLAGVSKDRVVAAHGNFDSASCIACGEDHCTDWVKRQILAGKICHCTRCKSLVKPDIVFFGENLPVAFFSKLKSDMPQCDLLIVMGTSLVVYPFAGLLNEVPPTTPRLLINREVVGEARRGEVARPGRSVGFQFDPDLNYRDAKFIGDCDEAVHQLTELLGWREELRNLQTRSHALLDGQAPRL